jgi:hypothetical protein
MSVAKPIWNKILVRSFYRENAGFFLFIFLVFFGVVQPSTQLYFHYALIRGILETPAFFSLVAFAWALYALRVRRFIVHTLGDPDALFLYKVNAGQPRRIAEQCTKAAISLLGPVIGYAAIIIVIAITRRVPGKALGILAYMTLLTSAIAWEMRRRLRYPGNGPQNRRTQSRKSGTSPHRMQWRSRRISFASILLRFLWAENKATTVAVKAFSCGLLFLLLHMQAPDDYDLRMPFLAYSIALFGHGILFYRCRKLSDTRLLGYLSLPVNDFERGAQYAIFCLLLLVPEMVMLGWLTPHPIKLIDALVFAGAGYAILLTLYATLLTWTLSPANYLKICLILFGILYCLVMMTWR